MNNNQRANFNRLISRISRGRYYSTSIELKGYALNDIDAQRLLDALDSCPKIKARISHLDLSDNKLGVFILKSFSSLVSLLLNNNNIRLIALTDLPSLQVLNVAYNRLAHAKTISSLTSLVSLNLRCNVLPEISLYKNKKLQDLDLSHNSLTLLDLSHFKKLQSAKLECNPIRTLYIAGSPLSKLFRFTSSDLDMPSKIEAFKRHSLAQSNSSSGHQLVEDVAANGVRQQINDNIALNSEDLSSFFAAQMRIYSKNVVPDLLFEAQKLCIYLSVRGNLPIELSVTVAVDYFIDRLRAHFLPSLHAMLINPASANTPRDTVELRQAIVRDYLNNGLEMLIMSASHKIQATIIRNKALGEVMYSFGARCKTKPKTTTDEQSLPRLQKHKFFQALTPFKTMLYNKSKQTTANDHQGQQTTATAKVLKA